MNDIENAGNPGNEALEVAERSAKGTFVKGHPKRGGRKKGVSNWGARAIADRLMVNPIEIGLEILRSGGYIPLAPGETPAARRRVSPELYVKLVIEMSGYLAPKLSAQSVTAQSVTATASLDITALMASPETASLAQDLAIALAAKNSGHRAIEDSPSLGIIRR